MTLLSVTGLIHYKPVHDYYQAYGAKKTGKVKGTFAGPRKFSGGALTCTLTYCTCAISTLLVSSLQGRAVVYLPA